MIDPSFWEDEKLGSCEPVARLLFMGLISQADDDGRLKGHPSLLRSIIFPYDDSITAELIEIWLTKLADNEHQLIKRYEVDNQKYIFITNFKKHQTINKPQKSKLPPPSDNYRSVTVMVSEQFSNDTAEEKLIEEKLIEEKRREVEACATTTTVNPFRLFELEGFGTLSATIGDRLGHMINEYGERWTCEAMKVAVFRGKRSLGYVDGVLKSFKSSGIDEPWIEDKKEVGEQNGKHGGYPQGFQSGRDTTTKPEDSITGGEIGWIGRNKRNKDMPLSGVP